MQAGRDVHAVIDELRERIRRIERKPPSSERRVASGWAEVDGLLGGGFPRGALAEIVGSPGSGKTALALGVVASVTGEGALAAFVDARGELYPPAAEALGVDLERLLIVRPPGRVERGRPGRGLAPGVRDALWAAEALLASGAFAVVAVDAPVEVGARAGAGGASAEAMLRRLQGAAEKGGAAGLWLGEPGGCRAPAAIRLEVAREGDRPRVRRQGALGGRAGGAGAGHAA